MRFEDADAHVARPAYARGGWLNVVRVLVGFGSLTAAFWAATYFSVGRSFFVLFLVVGLITFIAMMLALGRDIASRWIAFGAAVGFVPASRRPFLDFGTDRPVLHGCAGRHAARLKLVVTTRGRRAEEWLQAEVDLISGSPDLHKRAHKLGLRVRGGRLVVRERFLGMDEGYARAFLDNVGRKADALVDV